MMTQFRLKREATVAAIKQEIFKIAAERPDLEQAHILCKHQDVEEPRVDSCFKNGGNKWRERGVVERWSRQAAIATGGQLFNARWVDEKHKEKSR